MAGNSSFPSLVQSRYNALLRITRSVEGEVRKARASLSTTHGSSQAQSASPASTGSDGAGKGERQGGREQDPASLARDALGAITCALLEHSVRQEPSRCEALFHQLCSLLRGVPAGSLSEDAAAEVAEAAEVKAAHTAVVAALRVRKAGGGVGAGPGRASPRPGAGAGTPAGAPGALSLGDLSAFLVKVGASHGVVPPQTRAVAVEVGGQPACMRVCVVCTHVRV